MARRPRGAAPGGAADTPTTPDALEMAMEADVSGSPPGAEAVAVLRKQSALFDEQIGLARNERFRNRIKAIRDMALSAAVLVLVGGAGVLLWNAHQASGLVVEAFRTPPDMAAEGLDGSVVAARLLDRLSGMQAGTDSSRAPSTFGNNWGDDLAVEVPQTGMSAGELWRMLRQTLGDETRLSGDLTRAADGTLTLTTRVGANPGVSVTGTPGELDRLLDQSAEAVYRQAQPYRYGVWLNRNGRRGENAALLADLAASSDRTERLWALVGQAVNAYETDPLQSLTFAREALAIDPTFQKARWNLSDAFLLLGWSEADLQESRSVAKVLVRRDLRVTEVSQEQVLHSMRGAVAEYLADYESLLENSRFRAGLPDYANNVPGARYLIAASHVGLHDLTAARSALAAADRISPLPGASLLVGASLAMEAGNRPEALALARQAVGQDVGGDFTNVWSAGAKGRLAQIMAQAGDIPAAEAVLAGVRSDCYDCAIARAKIADARGDRAGAIRWFRHATDLGPSLPQAWHEWGRARLAWGNADGARLAFEQAARRGPRWADPLKHGGDALMAAGDGRGAERLYRQAAERAPRWGALQLAWGRALEVEGRREAALDHYRMALTMDLIPSDRAEAQGRITGAGR